MDGMAILTKSTAKSSKGNSQTKPEIIDKYASELGSALRYSNFVCSAVFSILQQIFFFVLDVVTYLLAGSRNLIAQTVAAFTQIAWAIWDSKRVRRLRKRVEFEFFVLVLGSGNGLILMLFWPGWIVLALAVLAFRAWAWAD